MIAISIVAIGAMAGTASAGPGKVGRRKHAFPVQRYFRLTNAGSHGDGGLNILEFLADSLLGSGKTTSIPPNIVFGVKGVEHADLVVQIELSCDPGFTEPGLPPERLLVAPTFFVELTVSGAFTRHGRRVKGSVAVKLPKFKGTAGSFSGGEGGVFTNCMTDPNLDPSKLGRPLKFQMAA